MNHSTPGLPVHHQLPETTQTMSNVSVMPSNHLILCHRLLLLPSIFPSIRVFSNESALRIRWPKYWSFSLSISPSSEYSGLAGSPCNSKDSQESSPTSQFKSINYLDTDHAEFKNGSRMAFYNKIILQPVKANA